MVPRLQENAQDSDEEDMPGDEPSAQFWSQAFRKKIRDNDKLYHGNQSMPTETDKFGAVKAYFLEHSEEEKKGH